MKIGIVGLPNVGKSTLFNALTGARALVANYPFATIHPNVGVVPLPDERLTMLAGILGSAKIIPASVEFVDIAGLVKGASQGEGLGNQFLSHIREVDAILHVVRCFEDERITHVNQVIDPVGDYRTVEIELILADLAHLEKRRLKVAKQAKSHAAELLAELEVIDALIAHLNLELPARSFPADRRGAEGTASLDLLTDKPVLVAANIQSQADGQRLETLEAFLHDQNVSLLPVMANLESEIALLSTDEQKAFRDELGLPEEGLETLIQEAYRILGRISFFTGNEKEAHAWTIQEGWKAPRAAGRIHTDFERGFIRAEVIHFEDLKELGSLAAVREKGLLRSEGKTYQVRDGDYIVFRFNI